MADHRKREIQEFKLAAVKRITDRKHRVAEVARRLGVSEQLLRDWK